MKSRTNARLVRIDETSLSGFICLIRIGSYYWSELGFWIQALAAYSIKVFCCSKALETQLCLSTTCKVLGQGGLRRRLIVTIQNKLPDVIDEAVSKVDQLGVHLCVYGFCRATQAITGKGAAAGASYV